MKKGALFFLFSFLLCFFSSVNAFQSLSGESIDINQEVMGDIYVVASKLTINAPIQGDVIFIGGELDVNQKVEGDINAIAGKVFIHGNVGDDIRVLGGEVNIKNATSGDVILGGNNIVLDDSTLIAGSAIVYAGNIKNAATVSGDMKISGGNFDFDGTVFGNAYVNISENVLATKESRIRGNLVYSAPKKSDELESGTFGKKVFTFVEPQIFQTDSQAWFTFSVLYSFLFLFGFGVVFYFFFEKFFGKVQLELKLAPLKSFLLGLALYIGLPVLSVLLIITIIGIPFGILGLVLFVFLFILAKLVGVLAISSYIIHRIWGQKSVYFLKKMGIIAGLSIIFALVPLIPFLVSIFVYGAILTQKWEILKTLR